MKSSKSNCKEKLQLFFEEKYNITFSDAELAEIQVSLQFLGRAIYRYNLIQRGVIKREE